MEIHEAKPSDAPRLAEILRVSPEAGAWSEDELRRSIEYGGKRHCLVAEEQGRVLGFLLAERPVEDEAEILTLAVDTEARRRGVASALLRAFLASHNGKVFLEVRCSNLPGQRLYERSGFTVCGVRRGYYQSPAEDALVMQLTSPQ